MKYRNLIRFSNGSILKVNEKKSTSWLNFVRFAKNSANDIGSSENGNTTKHIPRLLDKYLKNNGIEVQNIIPEKYLTITSRNMELYLINPEVAKEFVSIIKDDLLENAVYVIETNPGPGFLTQELLKIGIPFIHLYEKDYTFHKQLETLKEKFPERLSIQYANLFYSSRLPHIFFKYNKFNIYDIFKNVPEQKWEERSCIQIIGTLNDMKFIRHLILSTVFQTCLMVAGRTTFYLAIPPFLFDTLRPTSRINTTRVLLQILFNCKILGTVDKKAYIPWQILRRNYLRRTRKFLLYNSEDSHLFHVVKLEPKPEVFKMFKRKGELTLFWHFVRHNCYRPSNRVIPALEKIIPGCGIRLIAKDYNIFTQFNDLTAQQIYELFLEFRSWPEFETSTFTASANEIQKLYDLYNLKDCNILHSDNDDH